MSVLIQLDQTVESSGKLSSAVSQDKEVQSFLLQSVAPDRVEFNEQSAVKRKIESRCRYRCLSVRPDRVESSESRLSSRKIKSRAVDSRAYQTE
jgi:hypothetical protein